MTPESQPSQKVTSSTANRLRAQNAWPSKASARDRDSVAKPAAGKAVSTARSVGMSQCRS